MSDSAFASTAVPHGVLVDDRPRGLTEQRERLRSILEGVQIAADELMRRLEPVLTPLSDKAAGEMLREIAAPESALALEIRERADAADRLQYQLRSLVERLELD